MGLGNLVHWVAWFIQTFSITLISIIILVILLKVGRVTEMTDLTVMFVFLVLFAIATITQCFLISTLFSKANLAAACGAVVYFLLYMPYAYLRPRAENLDYSQKTSWCLLSQVAFGWGCAILAGWEEEGSGLQWSNVGRSPSVLEEFNFFTAMWMLIVDSVIHVILTWYIEAVFPGQYGISRPWYFPVLKSYWFDIYAGGTKKVEFDVDGTSGPPKDKLEEEPKDLTLGVSIRNLRKVFSNGKVAVDGLSVNFYEGQITSFLGHNGAGKTTTMSILTGLYSPTEGTALIYGRDIRREFPQIRKSIGMCPQHNVLFDYLTVKQQLMFYAGLKGVKSKCIESEVNKIIEDVGLPDKSNELAKNLSGGMQRKLSIAVAFIGNSRTVFLDEPTAGVDPYARRGIWDLLFSYKPGRTIILSTHHMDEADLLGDRIAIISGGKLQCCGSSIFLKNRFGSGYHLTVVRNCGSGNLGSRKNPVSSEQETIEEGKKDLILPMSKLPPLTSGHENAEKMNGGSVQDGKPFVIGGNLAPLPPIGSSSESDSSELVKFVEEKVPGAKLIEDVGSELVFNLPSNSPDLLEKFFGELDDNLTVLGVAAYGVSDTTLEEIFLKMVGTEGEERYKKERTCDCCPSLRKKLRIRFTKKSKSVPGTTADPEDTELVDSEEEVVEIPDKGVGHPKIRRRNRRSRFWLCTQRMKALLIKRFHNFRRNLKGAFCEILLPVLMVGLTMLLLEFLPSKPNDQPPLLLTPWLYGTESEPNYIFLSLQGGQPGTNKWGKKVLESILKPPGLGIRCMPKSILKHKKCKREKEYWSRVNYANVSVEDDCYCNKKGEYECEMDAYHPPPPMMRTNTTDILVNMTGRNITQWLLMTEKKYRKQRYGGFSLGEVSEYALKNKNLSEIETQLETVRQILGAFSRNVSIDWHSENRTAVPLFYGNNESFPSFRDVLNSLFSGLNVRNNVKVWFNNQGWAALPAYASALSNALLRASLSENQKSEDYGIATYNHPINYSKNQKIGSIEAVASVRPRESFQAVMIILAFSVVPASFVLFIIDEMITHSKHLQFVSGVGPVLYWSANIIWDMMNFLIPVLLCMLIFYIFKVEALILDFKTTVATFLLFMTYGFAIIPLMYPFTFAFRVPSLAFITLAIGNFFLGVVSTLTTATLELLGQTEGEEDLLRINEICKKVFLLLPQYCLGRGVLDLKISYLYYSKINQVFGFAEIENPFEWDLLGKYFLSLVCEGILGFLLVMLIEHRYILNKCYKRKRERKNSGSLEENEDSDVSEERRRVLDGRYDDSAVCITGLAKVYYKGCCKRAGFNAVDDLCLAIKSGECFGLLGVNGAGKTTTFKMLTGKTTVSKGDAYFSGLSVKRDLQRVHQMIGYCPQFDALHGLLTGEEQLALYARLRGMEEDDIKKVVSWAISHMHLKAHASHMTKNYSGGNKRKLSTAIALIGNPPVVLLDEPTTGMDPKARRFLWNRIIDVVKEDRCVILTSHSMEECETLCKRIGIMVNGRLKCLGSVQHLKHKFGEGYTLSMMLQSTDPQSVELVMKFVESEFPGAILKERHRGMLQYRLPVQGVKLPKIFAVVQQAKEKLKLEDYALCQTTLDQVFISFAEQQKEDALTLAKGGSAEIRTDVGPDNGTDFPSTQETGSLLNGVGEEESSTASSKSRTGPSSGDSRTDGKPPSNFHSPIF